MAGPRVVSMRPTDPGAVIGQLFNAGAQIGAQMVQFGQSLQEQKRQYNANQIWKTITERAEGYPDKLRGFFADPENEALGNAYFEAVGVKSDKEKAAFIRGLGAGLVTPTVEAQIDVARAQKAAQAEPAGPQAPPLPPQTLGISGREEYEPGAGPEPPAITPPTVPPGARTEYEPAAGPVPIGEVEPVSAEQIDAAMAALGADKFATKDQESIRAELQADLAAEEEARTMTPSVMVGPVTPAKEAATEAALAAATAAIENQDPTKPVSVVAGLRALERLRSVASAGATERDKYAASLAPLEAKYRPLFGDTWKEDLVDIAYGTRAEKLRIRATLNAAIAAAKTMTPKEELEYRHLLETGQTYEGDLAVRLAELAAERQANAMLSVEQRQRDHDAAVAAKDERKQLMVQHAKILSDIRAFVTTKGFINKDGSLKPTVYQEGTWKLYMRELAENETALHPERPHEEIYQSLTPSFWQKYFPRIFGQPSRVPVGVGPAGSQQSTAPAAPGGGQAVPQQTEQAAPITPERVERWKAKQGIK